MRLQLQNKINELAALKAKQWAQLNQASDVLAVAEAADPFRELRAKMVVARDAWCATNDRIKALEAALTELDGFGASDAEVGQPIGLEAK